MRLPEPRGPLSASVRDYLAAAGSDAADRTNCAAQLRQCVEAYLARAPQSAAAVCADGDLQAALGMLYELSFGGFEDVDDGRDRDLEALAALQALEPVLVDALLAEARTMAAAAAAEDDDSAPAQAHPLDPNDVAARLQAVVAADDSPSLAQALMRAPSRETVTDYVKQRSVYQLREADPHTFAIPRLRGRAKSALVEIQRDEYGEGRRGALHADLYAVMMRELGLDVSYGAYWDETLPEMLAVLNLMSAFALTRRWRGALMGHLAAYEMTSSLPSRRLSTALRKVGVSDRGRCYYDEHVEADAVHEQIAAHDLCGSLAQQEPQLAEDIVIGAAACLAVEGFFATAMLERWQETAAA